MNKYLNKPLTKHEINEIVGRNVNMITYPELRNYDDIYDVLGQNGECIILYQTSDNYGHWTCIFERKNGNIEVFDSYGFEPDEQVEYMRPYYREVGIYLFPHLSYLLLESGQKIEYNNHKLQGPKTSTCGRWVGHRLKHKNKKIDTFAKDFKGKNKDMQIVKKTII